MASGTLFCIKLQSLSMGNDPAQVEQTFLTGLCQVS